jgi:glycosyltransferase involved in cell wall biosynthesis
MRVLTVGNMYPPLSLGGYELAWKSSVEQLRSRGHEVEVLTTDYGLGEGPAPDGEPGVHRELRWYWHDHAFPPRTLRERVAIECANATALGRRLEALRPDLVAWWSMGGMSLSLIERVRRAGIPAAGIICDDWLLYGPQVDAWSRIWRGRRRIVGPVAEKVTGIPARIELVEGVGPVMFASEALRSQARKRGVEPVTSEVGHRGVERDLFRAAPRPEWRWRLVCVGRIDPRKGIDLAIEAVARLPEEATLAVVGGGDQAHLDELRELARARGVADRVTFGSSDRDGLQRIYAEADAVLFPVVWEEPWGLVPLEAMAVGAPVVASGRGGSAEYLRDRENCLIFDVDRGGEALAAAVRELAAEPELRERLRTAGFETSGRLTVEAYDEAIERMLLAAAKRHPSAR